MESKRNDVLRFARNATHCTVVSHGSNAAADFAFAEEGDEAAERAAAELVLRWMFREEAGDPTSAEGNAKTTTARG